MIILSESVLIESKSARDNHLTQLSHDKAEDLLTKVKALYFALWKGTKIITTEQLAEFYEVDDPAILRKVLTRHKSELQSDGLKTLRGKELRDARDMMSLPSRTSQVTIWTHCSLIS